MLGMERRQLSWQRGQSVAEIGVSVAAVIEGTGGHALALGFHGVNLVLNDGPVDVDEVLVVADHPETPESRDWGRETGTAISGDT